MSIINISGEFKEKEKKEFNWRVIKNSEKENFEVKANGAGNRNRLSCFGCREKGNFQNVCPKFKKGII